MGRARFQGKVALVTGAATGIGRAVVQGLVDEGAMVCFTDLNEAQGNALASDLHGRAAFYRSDATDETQVRSLIHDVVGKFGRLDVAVNNVGNMAAQDQTNVRIHESTADGWEGTLALSLRSNFFCMKHELAQMLAQGGGVIANAASTAGLIHAPLATAAYHAAKAGVIHLTELAAAQYAQDNIRVNAIAPGFTYTDAVSRHFGAPDSPALLDMVTRFHAVPRVLDPREVAEAYLWVCSDEASGVTGTTIPVDCGWRVR